MTGVPAQEEDRLALSILESSWDPELPSLHVTLKELQDLLLGLTPPSLLAEIKTLLVDHIDGPYQNLLLGDKFEQLPSPPAKWASLFLLAMESHEEQATSLLMAGSRINYAILRFKQEAAQWRSQGRR